MPLITLLDLAPAPLSEKLLPVLAVTATLAAIASASIIFLLEALTLSAPVPKSTEPVPSMRASVVRSRVLSAIDTPILALPVPVVPEIDAPIARLLILASSIVVKLMEAALMVPLAAPVRSSLIKLSTLPPKTLEATVAAIASAALPLLNATEPLSAKTSMLLSMVFELILRSPLALMLELAAPARMFDCRSFTATLIPILPPGPFVTASAIPPASALMLESSVALRLTSCALTMLLLLSVA